MKKTRTLIGIGTALLSTLAIGQDVTVREAPGGLTLVSITSKGHDVRDVLHDLFTQAGKNYIVKEVPQTRLFISLNGVAFDEALELVADSAGIHYAKQNGIYTITAKRGSTITPTNTKPTPSNQAQPKPNAAPTKVNPKPTLEPVISGSQTGKLKEAVLNKLVSGAYVKIDFRKLVGDLGKQAGVKIEIHPDVPKYSLDFTVKQTSLGWSLRKLCQVLKLELKFTNNQSILISPIAK